MCSCKLKPVSRTGWVHCNILRKKWYIDSIYHSILLNSNWYFIIKNVYQRYQKTLCFLCNVCDFNVILWIFFPMIRHVFTLYSSNRKITLIPVSQILRLEHCLYPKRIELWFIYLCCPRIPAIHYYGWQVFANAEIVGVKSTAKHCKPNVPETDKNFNPSRYMKFNWARRVCLLPTEWGGQVIISVKPSTFIDSSPAAVLKVRCWGGKLQKCLFSYREPVAVVCVQYNAQSITHPRR